LSNEYLFTVNVYLTLFKEIQSCGANGIFSRRLDFSAFNSLPRTKLNSYHIKNFAYGAFELRRVALQVEWTGSSGNVSRSIIPTEQESF
ncbi:Headcase protein, partial [Trachymyrmex septentrionalis]